MQVSIFHITTAPQCLGAEGNLLLTYFLEVLRHGKHATRKIGMDQTFPLALLSDSDL